MRNSLLLTIPINNVITRPKQGLTGRGKPVDCSDETSVRVQGKTQWEWVFQNAAVCLHVICASWGSQVITEVMADAQPAVRSVANTGYRLGLSALDAISIALDPNQSLFAPG